MNSFFFSQNDRHYHIPKYWSLLLKHPVYRILFSYCHSWYFFTTLNTSHLTLLWEIICCLFSELYDTHRKLRARVCRGGGKANFINIKAVHSAGCKLSNRIIFPCIYVSKYVSLICKISPYCGDHNCISRISHQKNISKILAASFTTICYLKC